MEVKRETDWKLSIEFIRIISLHEESERMINKKIAKNNKLFEGYSFIFIVFAWNQVFAENSLSKCKLFFKIAFLKPMDNPFLFAGLLCFCSSQLGVSDDLDREKTANQKMKKMKPKKRTELKK